MRRLGLAVAVALLLAPAALASDHLMLVNEVRPGGPGDGFVELRDPFPEPFPETSYTVAAFDSGNVKLTEQVLLKPYVFENSTAPYVTGAFAVELPAAGKVCFYAGNGTGGRLINCLVYAGVPAGQSAQRQSCGAIAIAPPTSGAPNAVVAGACPTGGGGGPGGGDPGGGGNPPALTPVAAKLGGAKRQRLARLRVKVSSDDAARLTATGAARIGRRKLGFRKVSRDVAAGGAATLALKFPKARKRAISKALRAGRKITVSVRVTAVAAGRPTTTLRRSIRVRR